MRAMFSADSVLKQTGFNVILCQFRYFAFNVSSLDPLAPVVNRWLASFYLLITIGSFITVGVTSFIGLIANYPIVDLNKVCVWVIICLCYLITVLNYIAILYQAGAYRILLRSISSAIDAIPHPEIREKVIKRIKNISAFSLITLILLKTAVYFIVYFNGRLWLYKPSNEAASASFWLNVLNHLVFAGNTVWMFSVASFYIFTSCMIITVCRLLLMIMDVYFGELRKETKKSEDHWYTSPSSLKPEEISRRIILHQKISLIVREADKVFSNYLLIALSMEVIISVVYVKLLNSHDRSLTFTAHRNCMHMFLLVVKAIYCANVNDKLESSLLTNNVYLSKELSQCSSEQIYYIQYLNEQRTCRAQLTYGGLFPVRKSFIFTVLGTIVTYALIVNQV